MQYSLLNYRARKKQFTINGMRYSRVRFEGFSGMRSLGLSLRGYSSNSHSFFETPLKGAFLSGPNLNMQLCGVFMAFGGVEGF